MQEEKRVIVALDFPRSGLAITHIERLAPYVRCFKIGPEYATAEGLPQVLAVIKMRGVPVFYDAKFHDTPSAMAGAARSAARLGVEMFSIHASAGREAIQAAVENKGQSKVLGVTVLTSLSDQECERIYRHEVREKAFNFAEDLLQGEADGLICSPWEAAFLRGFDQFNRMIFVTPGVRPRCTVMDDHKRAMTPAEAITAGADYLVIGRPITDPPPEIGSPVEVIKQINEEIQEALAARKEMRDGAELTGKQ